MVGKYVHRIEMYDSELEAFNYSVSHDLRAPLRAIDGYSAALAEDCAEQLDERGKTYIRRVRGAARRMGQLIDDLLRLSKVSRKEITPVDVDLSALARAVADQLNEKGGDRHVSFVIAPGIRARGDPELLRIVLENLMGNAWKLTSKKPEARIELGETEHDGDRAFFVRDDGIGFESKYTERLFRPFERLHSIDEFEGTGIGLATVQRIVHRHGGRVWARGEIDSGATFFFILP